MSQEREMKPTARLQWARIGGNALSGQSQTTVLQQWWIPVSESGEEDWRSGEWRDVPMEGM